MFDVGWSELFIIALLAVVLVGPQDMPKVMVFFGRIFRRLHYVKFALSQQFDDLMRDADLNDIRKSVNFEAQAREDRDGGRIEEIFDEASFDEEAEIDLDYENGKAKSDSRSVKSEGA